MYQTRTSGVVFSLALFAITLGASGACASETEGLPVGDWVVGYVFGSVTQSVGYNVSVAVDPETGHTYVSYYEGIDGDLWLARTGAPIGNCGPNNTWECRVLDSDGIVGKYSSIAVGGPGPVAKLYISYHDATTGDLTMVEGEIDRITGALSWATHPIESGDSSGGVFVGVSTSVTIDPSGRPHVGYEVDDSALGVTKYATKVDPGAGNCGPSDTWNCGQVISGASGNWIDIELDANDVPSIAFSVFSDPLTDYMIVAEYVGSGGNCFNSNQWDCEYLYRPNFDIGAHGSFAIGNDGTRHLAYRNDTMQTVEWARFVGSGGSCGNGTFGDTWICSTLDYVGPGGSPSGVALETDDEAHPVVVYQRLISSDADLRIARPKEALNFSPTPNCGPGHSWFCETLLPGGSLQSHAYGGLSIAMTARGEAVVADRVFNYGAPPYFGYLAFATESWTIFRDGFESGDTTRWSATTN